MENVDIGTPIVKNCHCEHNRQKSRCKECKGSGICEHNRIKSRCKECKGGSICEHNHIKTTCKECKGGSICEHNHLKNQCKECKGGSTCEHNISRSTCFTCRKQPILTWSFPLCGYQTKVRGSFNRHQKTHTLENALKKK